MQIALNKNLMKACPEVHFHNYYVWQLHEDFVKNNKVNVSRALFRSYGALFAVEMQQNGVQSVKAMVKNGFVISLSTIIFHSK